MKIKNVYLIAIASFLTLSQPFVLKASAKPFLISNRYGDETLCLQQTGFKLTLGKCDTSNNSQQWEATKHYYEWHILQNVGSKKCLWFDKNRLTFKDCLRNKHDDKKNLWKGIGGDIFSGNTQNVKITVWDKEGQCITHYRTEVGEEMAMTNCAHLGGNLSEQQDWRRLNF